jgi:H+-transporting ATPase
VIAIVETNFFQDTFGVSLSNAPGERVNHNDPRLHMVIYLQVAVISQALIFVTRSHGFFFMERPSYALLIAFCIAQLVSSIIAAYGNWGFTKIHSISGGWIGIVWVWVSVDLPRHVPRLPIQSLEHHLVYPSRLGQVRDESHRHPVHP